MCEDETLFCNYTLQNMEQTQPRELPTWGQYLRILPGISNRQPLTGGGGVLTCGMEISLESFPCNIFS